MWEHLPSAVTLFTGLSGLDVNTTQMNVIGNNIANVNTTAFQVEPGPLSRRSFMSRHRRVSPPSADNGGSNPQPVHGLERIGRRHPAGFLRLALSNPPAWTRIWPSMAVDSSSSRTAAFQQYTRDRHFHAQLRQSAWSPAAARVMFKASKLPSRSTAPSCPGNCPTSRSRSAPVHCRPLPRKQPSTGT